MVLDTDVLIDLVRELPSAETWLAGVRPLPSIAGFSALELLAGSRDRAEFHRMERFLATFVLLWPSESDLERARSEYLPLRLATGIGIIDAVIASTATGHGLPLATFNARHFAAVPGLTVVEPYVR